MSRFTIPRDIFYGKGSMRELASLTTFKRAFIVTDKVIPKLGFLMELNDILTSAGMETRVYTGVQSDPDITIVNEGAELMRQFQPDLIVAIGGGSSIDAAKAMWVFYEHPHLTFNDILKNGVPPLRHKAHMAAIPSTSGTGSEVTSFIVISDHAAKIKYPIADFDLTPDIAVLDSEVAKTMPPKLAAYTAMDALCHAVEAYVAQNRSNFTNPLAIHAITVLLGYMQQSYDGDLDARGEMHIAQCLSGMAFANAGLGITHSLAHKIGGALGVPHGLCNAILMPYIIRYNAHDRRAMRHYANIGRRLGLEGLREMNLCNSLIRTIRDMADYMSIPRTLQEAGVKEEDYLAAREAMARNAMEDDCTPTNPRVPTVEDMERLLDCAYYGKPVNF